MNKFIVFMFYKLIVFENVLTWERARYLVMTIIIQHTLKFH